MAKKKEKKTCYVDGVPVATVKGLLDSPKVSPEIKKGWVKKLDRMGVKI